MITNVKKVILYLSETFEGKTHDMGIVNEEQWVFPKDKIIYEDKGFEGFNPEGCTIYRPMKKPKGRDLTAEEKQKNKEISKKRILIEHAIGSIKTFRIVKDTFRNWSDNIRDDVMEICCGLHNFKILFTDG